MIHRNLPAGGGWNFCYAILSKRSFLQGKIFLNVPAVARTPQLGMLSNRIVYKIVMLWQMLLKVIRFFFVMGVLLICNTGVAQEIDHSLDTIRVSASKTTTLNFPEEISLVDIGSEDFGHIKDKNLLLLKAVSNESKPTSLLVRYGTQLYHSTIAYEEHPKKLFIDFSKLAPKSIPQAPNESRAQKEDSLASLEVRVAQKRLNVLMAEPKAHYKDIVVDNAHIFLSLFSMMNDQENVFLKLYFNNSSKLQYEIDFVEFAYREPLEDKELKGQFERKPVTAKVSNAVDVIPAKEGFMLGYCIPKYSLTAKGELLIIIREKKGTRSLKLSIPFEKINASKQIPIK